MCRLFYGCSRSKGKGRVETTPLSINNSQQKNRSPLSKSASDCLEVVLVFLVLSNKSSYCKTSAWPFEDCNSHCWPLIWLDFYRPNGRLSTPHIGMGHLLCRWPVRKAEAYTETGWATENYTQIDILRGRAEDRRSETGQAQEGEQSKFIQWYMLGWGTH